MPPATIIIENENVKEIENTCLFKMCQINWYENELAIQKTDYNKRNTFINVKTLKFKSAMENI